MSRKHSHHNLKFLYEVWRKAQPRSYAGGANLLFNLAMSLELNPKAFSKRSSLIPDPKMADGTLSSPGFWLLKLPRIVAGSSPTFIWKWTRPLGKTITSTLSRTLAKTLFWVCRQILNKPFRPTRKPPQSLSDEDAGR